MTMVPYLEKGVGYEGSFVMKGIEFLNTLSLKDKVLYLIGLLFSRMSQGANYEFFKGNRILLNNIDQLGFEVRRSKTRNEMWLLRRDDLEIELRTNGSDFRVFQQVFVAQEYRSVIEAVLMNGIQVMTVIDAGCNIGLTSIQFLQRFPSAHIICIEPDLHNFMQMTKNLKNFSLNVSLLNNALWFKQENLFINDDFRDGFDWSRSVSVDQKESKRPIVGIPMAYVLDKFNIEAIDLLKMDIEGSEAEIFKPERDLSFLSVTKVIALEIHDEFNCRKTINDILIMNGFVIFNTGELTIGINKKLVLK